MTTPFNPTLPAVVQDISTLVGFFTSTKKVDVVQILNATSGAQVFATARPLNAFCREVSKGLMYPIETGATLTDSIIVEPTEIQMDFLITQTAYATVYPQMRIGRLAGTLYTVQLRTGTYKNMYIEEMPHDEVTDMMSAVKIHVKFKEALQVTASTAGATILQNNFSPAKPQNANTTAQGLLSGLATASSVLSYAHAATVVGL